MLYELPNGCWIRLRDVIHIEPLNDTQCGPRVIVVSITRQINIEFDLPEAAYAWARDFALKVNTVLSEVTSS